MPLTSSNRISDAALADTAEQDSVSLFPVESIPVSLRIDLLGFSQSDFLTFFFFFASFVGHSVVSLDLLVGPKNDDRGDLEICCFSGALGAVGLFLITKWDCVASSSSFTICLPDLLDAQFTSNTFKEEKLHNLNGREWEWE